MTDIFSRIETIARQVRKARRKASWKCARQTSEAIDASRKVLSKAVRAASLPTIEMQRALDLIHKLDADLGESTIEALEALQVKLSADLACLAVEIQAEIRIIS